MESTTWLWITDRSIGRSGKIQSLDNPSKLFDLHCGTSKIVQCVSSDCDVDIRDVNLSGDIIAEDDRINEKIQSVQP